MNKKRSWLAIEDSILFCVVRDYSQQLRSLGRFVTVDNAVIKKIHEEYNNRMKSNGHVELAYSRDENSIFYRLASIGVTQKLPAKKTGASLGTELFVCKMHNLVKLERGELRPVRYKQFYEKLQEQALIKLKNDLTDVALALPSTTSTENINAAIDNKISELDLTHYEFKQRSVSGFSDVLNDKLCQHFLKTDLGLTVSGKNKSLNKSALTTALEDWINEIQSRSVNVEPMNELRGKIAEFYECGYNKPHPTFISCSVGTGIGKSYGALQSYVVQTGSYLENALNKSLESYSNGLDNRLNLLPNALRAYAEEQTEENSHAIKEIVSNGFTNYVFMTPQKAQIDLDDEQVAKLFNNGIQFCAALADSDAASPDYADWVTKRLNVDVLEPITNLLFNIAPECKSKFSEICSIEKEIEFLKKQGNNERLELVTIYENKLPKLKRSLVDCFRKAVLTIANLPNITIEKIIYTGAAQELINRESNSIKINGLLHCAFLLMRMIMPFEVAKYLPSVILMTSSKSLVNHYVLKEKRKSRKEMQAGNTTPYYTMTEGIPFDQLIGGKRNLDKVVISSVLPKSKKEKLNYLENNYFLTIDDCPYLTKNINFMVICDELHNTYNDHFGKTIKNLIDDKIHLNHVLGSAATLVHNAEEAIANLHINADELVESDESLMACILRFRKDLLQAFKDHCHFENGIDGREFLRTFKDSAGTFEVDSCDATAIIEITKNVFSFNAKLFANLDELRSIRLGHKYGLGAKRLYFEKRGEDNKDPSLYDLFQLVIALIAVGSKIKSYDEKGAFKRWIKCGGHSRDGNHEVLCAFIEKVESVASEVVHILDQPDFKEGTIKVDQTYAYFQPKVIFSFEPIQKIEGAGFHHESDKIPVAFNMDLIKASPEVSYLKMLIGTKNIVLPLSATAGYHGIYDGNYSTKFMKEFCSRFNVDYKERDSENLGLVEELVEMRGEYRDVKFSTISETSRQFIEKDDYPAEFSQPVKELYRKIFHTHYCKKTKQSNTKEPVISGSEYKKRELERQFSSLIYCAQAKENGLSLAISNNFVTLFSKKVNEHKNYLRDNFKLNLLFPLAEHVVVDSEIKAFEISIGDSDTVTRVILFDSDLAKKVDACNYTSLKELMTITDPNTHIVLMSSFSSAGTGLNNVITYKLDDQTTHQEDYKNLFICGSPFYSSIKNKTGTLDSIWNYALLLKLWGDDERREMLLSEIPATLNVGEPYNDLMREHSLAIEKLLIQILGRVERRDSVMETVIHLPEDVIATSAFVFRDFPENTRKNKFYRIYQGMSLLGKAYVNFAINYMKDKSFSNPNDSKAFEELTQKQGRDIDNAHNHELVGAILKYQETGSAAHQQLNEEFRSLECFNNPKAWVKKIEKLATNINAKNVANTAQHMFIPQERFKNVLLCEKPTGGEFALSDYNRGNKPYSPLTAIFPAYSAELIFNSTTEVRDIFKSLEELKTNFENSGFIPSKAILPLLRGNVGEYLVVSAMAAAGHKPMTPEEVKKRLGTNVYERFDFYYEINNKLFCIDAKFWSTKKDNPKLSACVRAYGKERKPAAVLNAVKEHSPDRYESVSFLYLNAFYGDTVFKENNRELNHDSTVAYLSVFNKEPLCKEKIFEVKNNNSGKETKKRFQVIEEQIKINSKLLEILNK